jgi:hypothetical protein
MRKAISFSGQSRFVVEGLETLRRNLVDFNNYDIFIHTWEGPLNKDCYLYEPKAILVEPQKEVVPPEVQECSPAAFIHFSMFYSIKDSLRLLAEYELANNFKYDVVIRTRFDIGLESRLDPASYNLTEGVFSPNVCANPLVISDWLNFSTSDNMKLYGEIYDNITNYFKVGVKITSGEELITHMLKTKRVPIKKIPCDLFLLRDRNIHHTLSTYWKYAN